MQQAAKEKRDRQPNPNSSIGNGPNYWIDSDHELYEVEGVELLTQTPFTMRITCPAAMRLEQLITLLQREGSNLLERIRFVATHSNAKAEKSRKQDQELVLDIRCIHKVGDTLLIRSTFDEDLLPF